MNKKQMYLDAVESMTEDKEGWFAPNTKGVVSQIRTDKGYPFQRFGCSSSNYKNFSLTKPKREPKLWEVCMGRPDNDDMDDLYIYLGDETFALSANKDGGQVRLDKYTPTTLILPEQFRWEIK